VGKYFSIVAGNHLFGLPREVVPGIGNVFAARMVVGDHPEGPAEIVEIADGEQEVVGNGDVVVGQHPHHTAGCQPLQFDRSTGWYSRRLFIYTWSNQTGKRLKRPRYA